MEVPDKLKIEHLITTENIFYVPGISNSYQRLLRRTLAQHNVTQQ